MNGKLWAFCMCHGGAILVSQPHDYTSTGVSRLAVDDAVWSAQETHSYMLPLQRPDRIQPRLARHLVVHYDMDCRVHGPYMWSRPLPDYQRIRTWVTQTTTGPQRTVMVPPA
jgi:hypothetical protein